MNSIHSIDPTFLDQKCKALVVAKRCLYSFGASIYHNIAAIASLFALRLPSVHEHLAFADYHAARLNGASSFYLRSRDRIINFGVNRVGPPFEHASGSRFQEWIKRSTSERIPLLESELKKQVTQACFGISLDYISRYLQKLKSGSTPKEAVIAVSQLFREKATLEAHMAQALHRAQDINTLKISWEKENQDARFEALAKLFSSPPGTQIDPPKPLSAEALIEMKDNLIAQNLGLKLSFTNALVNRVAKSEFNAHVKALKPGVYFVSCYNTAFLAGHAAVFIKVTESESYLHEPSEGSELLSEEAPTSSLQGPWWQHYFFACSLS